MMMELLTRMCWLLKFRMLRLYRQLRLMRQKKQ